MKSATWRAIYQESYLLGSSGIEKVHSHKDMHQIIYVVEGECEFLIGDKTYHAGANSLIVISNVESHQVNIITRPYKRYILYLSANIVQQLESYEELTSVFNCRMSEFIHCTKITGSDKKLRNHLDCLVDEYNSLGKEEDIYVIDAVISYILLILIEIFRNDNDYFPESRKKYFAEIHQVKEFIDSSFDGRINLDNISQRFHISKTNLCKKFKDVTGTSIKKYILSSRISAAKSLLYNTDMSVGQIAYQVGFSDINNFIRRFKTDVGMTPLQYRHSKRENF